MATVPWDPDALPKTSTLLLLTPRDATSALTAVETRAAVLAVGPQHYCIDVDPNQPLPHSHRDQDGMNIGLWISANNVDQQWINEPAVLTLTLTYGSVWKTLATCCPLLVHARCAGLLPFVSHNFLYSYLSQLWGLMF